ncbi:hypothetical protein [Paraburkholderia megapolitana]|uniref:Uncharacterized protein n=1 Tax=Paraburkholderia megapolitana TaxID=420953 RepID=A0A1I3WBY7_9BURK|nr:hypothetical protein [Paraburkholderia megapolitana]QDQ82236.1 hypothetical protein FNZ07_13135 [Paraburkholderia megapolitana]SFK03936.1 hypothetical protein SAMN05192543_11717 [Paraburkholderia megapolitana]
MAKKNPRTINEFLLYTLDLQLTSHRWSWDACGEDVAVLKLWEKRRAVLSDSTVRIEVWAAPPWAKPTKAARNERRRSIERLKGGGATYAVLRGGDGSDDSDSRDYDADRMVRLSHVQVDPDGYEYAVVDREVTVSDFLARGTGAHATPVTAAELTTLLASLGAPGVITKNNNPCARHTTKTSTTGWRLGTSGWLRS